MGQLAIAGEVLILIVHKGNQRLHENKAVTVAALGAIIGYKKKGNAKGAATGATVGALAGLFAGNTAMEAIK